MKLSAQVTVQRSWYYTAVDTLSVADLREQAFVPLKSASPLFHNKGIYWFRLDIENKQPDKDLIIAIKNPHLDSVFLFQSIQDEIRTTDVQGNDFKKKDGEYLRYVRFKVEGNTSTVWLKTRLKKEILFPVTVTTEMDFYKAESISLLKLGIYYGIAGIVLLVNLILYFSFREPKFLYYSCLLFLVTLLFAYADGLYVLVSRNAIWLNYASLPVMWGAVFASALFSAKFLELDHRYNYAYQITRAILFVIACCFLAYILWDWTGAVLLGNMGLPLLVGLYWGIAVSRFRKHIEARFYVLASTLSLFFTLYFFIFRFAGPNFLNLMPSELKIGNILQMLILSIGILHRVKVLHKEHAYYREEIQRYLKERPVVETDDKEVLPEQDVFTQLQDQFGLSEREIDVLKLLAEGFTNQRIGETLYLSSNTVKFHIRNIYMKMDINNRAQAVSKIHGVSA
ncbi:hypothetical protein G5B30_07685 [Sphingobacterium sp. SGG-5]|nr:hypothetical protein [Sphingobacterium sp. SGG-5]